MKNAFVLTSTKFGPMLVNRWDYAAHPCEGGQTYISGVGISLLEVSSYCESEIDTCFRLIEKRREAFGDGVVILDLGANIGVNSINWAKRSFDWASIIAIEAQVPVYYALCGNIALNNCWNIKAIRAVVGNQVGCVSIPVLDINKPANFGSLSVLEWGNKEHKFIVGSEDTPAMTVDQLNLDRLDFMKIDIEGKELDAIRGAFETIKRCKPIIFVEKNYRKEAFLEVLPDYSFVEFNDMNAIMEPL